MTTRPRLACCALLLSATVLGCAHSRQTIVAAELAAPRPPRPMSAAADVGGIFGPPASDPPRTATFAARSVVPTVPPDDPLYVVGRHFPLEQVAGGYEIGFPGAAERMPGLAGDSSRVVQAGYEEVPLPAPNATFGGPTPAPRRSVSDWPEWSETPWQNVGNDHLHFYSLRGLALVGVGVGVAAAMANTPVDEHINDGYHDYIQSGHSGLSGAVGKTKFMGNGWIIGPVCVSAIALGLTFDEDPAMSIIGDWGQRTARTLLVGAPPVLVLQYATGAGRPGEYAHGSAWRPFNDANGVSGHAFMGAVPWMVAAKMTDNIYLKAGLYGASLLTGWSRVDHYDHYPSQVVLGWWLAYAAATAIDLTELDRETVSVVPLPLPDTMGLGLELRK
jgi:hypothetical protein